MQVWIIASLHIGSNSPAGGDWHRKSQSHAVITNRLVHRMPWKQREESFRYFWGYLDKMLLANVYVSYSLSYSLERVRGVGKELLTILHELRRAFFFVLKASLAMLLAPQNVPVHSNTENASCICLNQGLFFFPLTGQAQCYHLLRNSLCQSLITVHPHGLLKSVGLWDIVTRSC